MKMNPFKGPDVGKSVDVMASEEQTLLVQIPRRVIFGDELSVDEQEPGGPITGLEKKPGWFRRSFSKSKPTPDDTIGIRMTKSEFMAYFARDEKTGEYRKGVIEPPEGRQAWLQKRLPENDPEMWDLQLRQSRQLVATRGVGYLGGIANPY